MRYFANMQDTAKNTIAPPLPCVCVDGSALNTVRCLVPGYILTNERLLLGFGGQSTYSAVNSKSKKKGKKAAL